MRTLTTHEANELLFCKGMKIGNWNELTELSAAMRQYVAYQPPANALELYVAAKQLLDWITLGGWILLQIDNSTAPAPDEIKIFEKLIFPYDKQWNIATHRSLLFDNASNPQSGTNQTSLVLFIFFSLIFEWHIYLVSENSVTGQCLALLDGMVYFFGNSEAIESANMLIGQLIENPLRFHQPR